MGEQNGQDKNKDKDGKGYEVKDKRAFTPEGDLKEAPPAAPVPPVQEPPAAAAIDAGTPPADHPPLEFGQFILSLATAALFHLGDAHEEGKEPPAANLPLAKETIDIIAMLKEKTKGNVTAQEEAFTEGLLFDLRMRYVAKTNKSKITL